jgi:hypothetical protein
MWTALTFGGKARGEVLLSIFCWEGNIFAQVCQKLTDKIIEKTRRS